METFIAILSNKKYFSSAFFFSGFSLIVSSWVIYIPRIAEKLSITEGKIGIAIFFSAVGALVIIPVLKLIIDRLGAGRLAYYSIIAYSLAAICIFLSSSYFALCASLFYFGMCGSSLSLSINSLVPVIEKTDKVYIMSGTHAFFSIGGMLGAGIGSFIAAKIKYPIIHIGSVILIILFIVTVYKKYYYNIKGENKKNIGRFIHFLKPLAVVAFIGLVIMVSEGAIADWSALYLKSISKTNIKFLGLGYSGFSLFMAIGRLYGDSISKKTGSWKLISFGSIIAIAGFFVVLLTNRFLPIIGFSLTGLGFSVIVPEVFRMASKMEHIDTSTGVSVITGSGYVGFLGGPVALGIIAEYYT
ncbi:MAG: MFS transporter, partial [Bacteroidales bacterium]|nr:MFS transporter [Bacteroidales bacterium]